MTQPSRMTKLLERSMRLGFLLGAPPAGFAPRNGKHLSWRCIADTRGWTANVHLRATLIEAAREVLPDKGVDAFAGIHSSGISWATALGIVCNLPTATIRLEPRQSGLQRQVEGTITGKRVLLVDNVIASGNSIARACSIAAEAGAEVAGAFAAVTLEDPPQIQGVRVYYCWTMREMLAHALSHNREGEIRWNT